MEVKKLSSDRFPFIPPGDQAIGNAVENSTTQALSLLIKVK